MVPKSRLDAKQRKYDTDKASWEAQLQTERDAHATTQSAFEAFKTSSADNAHLLRAGVTDQEDMELVQFRYGKLPEADRPSLQDWLADGAKSDRHLAPLFAKPAADTPPATPPPAADAAAPPATPKPPSNNAGATPPPGAASGHTVHWYNSLTPDQKTAQRKSLGQRTIDAGLGGVWPLGK